jgi:uncharacterized protein
VIGRHIENKILDAVKNYPLVTLTGPRQSGKTTLIKKIFSGYDYVNMEDPETRKLAEDDPRGFFYGHKSGLIIDEAQRVPDLFSYIQAIVDEEQKEGRFILSGSQNFLLLKNISQSLAGRTSIFHLLPFTKREIDGRDNLGITDLKDEHFKKINDDFYEQIYKGFYPRIYDKGLDPHDWLNNYFGTYIQRDVRTILNVADLDIFSDMVRLCAGRSGQILNISSLASDAGINQLTAKKWLSILETSFITFKLRPYHKNFSKRIIKSPKIYFYDTGLLCYLLRIRSPEELKLSHFRGAVFENYCIAEFLKSIYHAGKYPDIYFWRDSEGNEVDLLIEEGGKVYPVEFKSGQTFSGEFIKGIKKWNDLSGTEDADSYLIYGGERKMTFKGVNIIPAGMI